MDIQKEYDEICKQYGNLQFIREGLTAQLQQLDAGMVKLRSRRDDLLAALNNKSKEEAAHVVESTSGN